jgi:hypothetical protein
MKEPARHFIIDPPAPGDDRPRNAFGVLIGFGEAYNAYYRNRDMKANATLALATGVYRAVVDSTESLEHDDNIGPDLAYLLGAILTESGCEWPNDRPIIGVLRNAFPAHHAVWRFVTIETE